MNINHKDYAVMPFVTEGVIQIIKYFNYKGITFSDGMLANSATYKKLMGQSDTQGGYR